MLWSALRKYWRKQDWVINLLAIWPDRCSEEWYSPNPRQRPFKTWTSYYHQGPVELLFGLLKFFLSSEKKNLYLSWPLATIEKRVVSFYTGLKIAKVVIADLGGFNRDRILKAMIIRLISTSLSIKKTWHWLYYRFYAELKRTWIGNPFSEFSNDFRKKVFIKYQFKNKKTVIGERL